MEVTVGFDWDLVEQAAKTTGQAVLIGLTSNFSRKQKGEMSREAQKRGLNITLGNHERDPDERDDELYIMAKGTE